MGNRSYLYVVPACSDSGGVQIAEANNNFPTLWQLLLANGLASEPITDQRVFGDANTDNLAADADAAMDRLKQLADKMAHHPRLHEQPLLTLQFEGLLIHLQEVIDSVKVDTGGAVWFSANLDQLSWLESTSQEAFIANCQLQCNQRWQQIHQAMEANRYAALDEALGLLEYGQGFETWHAWAWEFGFSGIDHDYFSMMDSPQEIPFPDFRPLPREWENRLEDSIERFEAAGLWGIRQLDESGRPDRVILAPEWESISWATTGGVWLYRNNQFTYARLSDGAVEPTVDQLDEVWNFYEGEHLRGAHCAIVRQGALQGLLNADGSWLLAPSVEEIWGFENGFAPFRTGDKYGFINHGGQISIPALFDEVSSFSPSGLAPVWENDRVGLVDTTGAILVAPEFEQVEWRAEFRGFLVTKDAKVGLLHPDGSRWVSPEFDELKVLLTRCQIAARQGKRWGMLAWSGEMIAPPRFDEIEPRYADDIWFDEEAFSRLAPFHQQCIVRIDKQVGLIDATGKEIVPVRYAAVESFLPQSVTLANNEQPESHQHLVYILQLGPKRRKLRGVYDIQAGKEMVPCAWHHILDCQFDDQRWGFIVGMDVPKADQERLGEVRTGMLTAEGNVLFAPDYAWIGKAISIKADSWLIIALRQHLYQTWSAGQPLQAVPNESGTYVWLHPDGRVEQHIEYLLRSFDETNALDKALAVGLAYRDGIGVDADARLARQWLWKATGAIESETAPSLWKKLANKLGRSTADQERTPAPQATPGNRNPLAMYELALLLQTDQGGPVQADTAREWLRFSLQHGGDQLGSVLSELGYLLSEGIGGKEDRSEGSYFYEKAIELNNGNAMHNLGLAYQYGRGVTIDLPRALSLFKQAESTGDEGCAYHVGAVLVDMAMQLTGNHRQKKYSEAAYAFSKILYKTVEHSEAACAAYAIICLDPNNREYNPTIAEEVLLQAAERDDLDCITILIEEIYGNPASLRSNPAQHDYWQRRKAALVASSN